MTLRFILFIFVIFSQPAFSQLTTRIDGQTYFTGLLPTPVSRETGRVYFKSAPLSIPDSYDSREGGYVTPIKNQGSCGSCWSFSRTKALEAAFLLSGKAKMPFDLAEQDALVNDRNSHGCNGGYMDGRFEVNYGVTTEALCPYRASGRYSCNGVKYGKAEKWAFIGESNRKPTDEDLKQAIYQYKVISVVVAAGSGFSPNADGDIRTCTSRSINHMVTLAGYRPAANGGVEYLIGNSWGTGWGNGGFAWSKAFCNRLAEEALFFYIEGEEPSPVPVPVALDVPLAVGVKLGNQIALEVKPQPDIVYTWNPNAVKAARVWLKPKESMLVQVEAKDKSGNITQKTISIEVEK